MIKLQLHSIGSRTIFDLGQELAYILSCKSLIVMESGLLYLGCIRKKRAWKC